MNIIDLNGHPIEVTDLNKAIKIATECRAYRHTDKCFADFDKKMNLYWTDFLEKLLKLKSKIQHEQYKG